MCKAKEGKGNAWEEYILGVLIFVSFLQCAENSSSSIDGVRPAFDSCFVLSSICWARVTQFSCVWFLRLYFFSFYSTTTLVRCLQWKSIA